MASMATATAKNVQEFLKDKNECSVCIEPMNKSTRKSVECGFSLRTSFGWWELLPSSFTDTKIFHHSKFGFHA
jgi:hypothetical protein